MVSAAARPICNATSSYISKTTLALRLSTAVPGSPRHMSPLLGARPKITKTPTTYPTSMHARVAPHARARSLTLTNWRPLYSMSVRIRSHDTFFLYVCVLLSWRSPRCNVARRATPKLRPRPSLLSLEVVTPENKSIHSTVSSTRKKVRPKSGS